MYTQYKESFSPDVFNLDAVNGCQQFLRFLKHFSRLYAYEVVFNDRRKRIIFNLKI